jgi:hypothetical protein
MPLFKLPTKTFYFKSGRVTSLEMSQKIVNFVNSSTKFIGCNFASPGYTMIQPLFIITFLQLVAYMIISVQNIHMFRDNFERQMFCISTLGMGFQGFSKLYVFIYRREGVLKLFDLAEDFQKGSKGRSKQKIFEKWMLIAAHTAFLFGIAFLTVEVLLLMYPGIHFLIVGKKVLHFGFVIPGIDWTTPIGYSINFVYNITLILTVVGGVYTTTYYKFFLMLNVFSQYESVEVEIENLGELAINNKDNANIENIKKSMKKVAEDHVKILQ